MEENKEQVVEETKQDNVTKVEIKEIFVPVTETECEYIDGDDDEEKGRNLALKLREAKII